ncbi:Cupredoxin [Infundibulicybe gibba]|nr:Cupredoxin [Infundibulicybe gibba]
MFTTLLKIALFPALVAAQYGPPPPAMGGAPAPTAPADTPGHMNIDVAFNNGFVFHPANITAPVGTMVTFWFPNNGLAHSVTQSSFANPCTYLAASGNDSAGFDSGLQTNSQFSVNITDDTKPVWFHCKQVLHCGMGMVGSINAPIDGSNTFAAFHSAAVAIGSSEVTETDNGPVLGGQGGASAAAQTASGTSPLGSGGANAAAQSATSTATSSSIKIAANTAAIVMGVAIALWA